MSNEGPQALKRNPGCRSCTHFRPFRPLSQLLERELGAFEPECVSELVKLIQDEHARLDAEAELRVRLVRDRETVWPLKPRMSDFCGMREADGVWLIHEIKNRGNACNDHDPAPRKAKRCATCKHAVAAQGPRRDQEILREIAAAEGVRVVTGGGGASGQEASRQITLIGTRKALEAAKAYHSGRFIGSPPAYLAHCKAFSFDDNYVPCAVQNPHDACRVDDADQLPPPTWAAFDDSK